VVPDFRKPNRPEQIFNKIFRVLVGLGVAPRYNYLVEVRGRQFLVAPRGRTQWVRNAEAAGAVVLKRGSSRREFHIRPVSGDEKLDVLKTYLDRYKLAVQRYFPVRAGSQARAFREVADRYPVFELLDAASSGRN
jgi:hypothetical protein